MLIEYLNDPDLYSNIGTYDTPPLYYGAIRVYTTLFDVEITTKKKNRLLRYDQSGTVDRRLDVPVQSRVFELRDLARSDQVPLSRNRVRAVEIGLQVVHLSAPNAYKNRGLRQIDGEFTENLLACCC